jgi:HD superfamily phosphohydrolase
VIGFLEGVQPELVVAGKLYSFMYQEVYHCWQNISAQAMVAFAIEQVLRSGQYSWLDVIRLTDVELFAALESFGNHAVRELAYLVKYRRLMEPAGEVVYTGKLSLTAEDLLVSLRRLRPDILGHDVSQAFHDPFLLVVVVKPKRFIIRWAKMDGSSRPKLGKEEVLEETKGRIMFFKWPGTTFCVSGVSKELIAICEAGGVRVEGTRELL